MADIEQYLKNIMSAVYGEEVRGSIHDAIEAINNSVYDGTAEARGYAEEAQRWAEDSEQSASDSKTEAGKSQTAREGAEAAKTAAEQARDNAQSSASAAASSAKTAGDKATEAENYATLSKSWAVGGTSSRQDESTTNAKYFADEAKKALQSISGQLVARGTITFEQLKTVEKQVGYMYNISNDFITDSSFMEGAGHSYAKGTNVYYTSDSKWDCLAAPDYIKTIKVNGTPLVPDAGAAVDVKAYNEDNKPEIGGTNLLSKKLTTSGGIVTGIVTYDNDINGIIITDFDRSNKPDKDFVRIVKVGTDKFGYYSVSGEAYASANVELDIDLSGSSHRHTFQLTKSPQKIVGVYNITSFSSDYWTEVGGAIDFSVPKEWKGTIYVKNLKLERGEIPTDWSPAPEDLEAKIEAKIDNIEIGGRNYLLQTNQGNVNWSSTISPPTVTATFESAILNGRNGVRITISEATTTNGYVIPMYSGIALDKIVKDTDYTLSMFLRSNKEITGVRVNICLKTSRDRIFESDASLIIPKGDDFSKIALTMHTLSDMPSMTSQGLYINLTNESKASGAVIEIYDLKLEQGNVSTDWSLAPEDLEAEIPTKVSQLENDSKFITSNDIPEGAAASNTVPKAPAATGSVGSEMAFARGDHVHPYGHAIADSSHNNPFNTGIRFAYGDYFDDEFVSSVYPIISGPPKSGGGPIFGVVTKRFYKQRIGYAEISDITASNFSGVLPVKKGGTNSQGLFSDATPFPLTNFRTAFGQPLVGSFMAPVRVQGSDAWENYSSGLAFGAGDTNGYICISYTDVYPRVIVGGGNNENITWYKRLAFSDQIPSIATSSKAGLIKPGTGCEVTSDGTLNVTASGGISEIPVASATTLGGVKVGDNMKVTEDGTLTANLDGYWSNASTLYRLASINLPNIAFMAYNYASGSPGYVLPTSLIASESNLGLIKTGTGLTIDTNGVVSVDTSSLTPEIATHDTYGVIKLGDYFGIDENGKLRINFAKDTGAQIVGYEDGSRALRIAYVEKLKDYQSVEGGDFKDIRITRELADDLFKSHGTIYPIGIYGNYENSRNYYISRISTEQARAAYGITEYYATTSKAGIVKVGSGLSVDSEGTLSVDSQSTTNNFINLKALYVHEAAAPSIDPDVNGFTLYATGIYPSRTSEEADVSANCIINIDSADVSNVNCYFKATPINTAGTLASEDDAQSFLSGSMEFQFNQSRVTFGNYGSAKIFINTVLKSSVAKTIVELPSYTSTGTTYAALAEILRSAGITRLQCNGLSKQKLDLYG